MKRRLFLVCGLAEVWTCAALIRQLEEPGCEDTLLLYGMPISIPPVLRTDVLRLASAFHAWSNVIDLVDHTPNLIPGHAATAIVHEHLGTSVYDEIFTHTLDRWPEHAILAAIPDAGIRLFDNGLVSHIDKPVCQGFVKDEVPAILLQRVMSVHFSLRDELPVPIHLPGKHVFAIPSQHLRSAAQHAFENAPEEFPASISGAKHLLLGTSFYRTGRVKHEKERATYLQAIETIRTTSSGVILFKEHPRAQDRPLMSAQDGVVLIDSRMPIEAWPGCGSLTDTISISSTGQLMITKLFDVPGYSIGPELVEALKLSHVTMAHSHVPPLGGIRAIGNRPELTGAPGLHR